MWSLGILIGVFASFVGVMVYSATHLAKIALPLILGGLMLVGGVLSIMVFHI